jgi:hypothetical protein
MTTALLIINAITICACAYVFTRVALKNNVALIAEEVDYLHGVLQGFSDYAVEQFGKIEEDMTNILFTNALAAATLPAGTKNTPAKKIAAKKAVAKKAPAKKAPAKKSTSK